MIIHGCDVYDMIRYNILTKSNKLNKKVEMSMYVQYTHYKYGNKDE